MEKDLGTRGREMIWPGRQYDHLLRCQHSVSALLKNLDHRT